MRSGLYLPAHLYPAKPECGVNADTPLWSCSIKKTTALIIYGYQGKVKGKFFKNAYYCSGCCHDDVLLKEYLRKTAILNDGFARFSVYLFFIQHRHFCLTVRIIDLFFVQKCFAKVVVFLRSFSKKNIKRIAVAMVFEKVVALYGGKGRQCI